MKNLFIALLLLSGSLMAQPPLPGVDDGSIVLPIDQYLIVPAILAVLLVVRTLLKKRIAAS